MEDKMYKLLLLTFHRAQSYGAFLQAYALQNCKQLKEINPVILDYYPKRFHFSNYVFPVSGSNFIIKVVKMFPTIIAKGRMHYMCQRYVRKYLKLTKKRYETPTDLQRASNLAEIFLTGSDQIWDLRYDDLKEVMPYYLNFTKQEKYAYASSCGEMEYYTNRSKEEYKVLMKCLSYFNRITVREQYSVDDLNKCNKFKCEMMLDPTFLLNADDWKKVATPISNSKYILVYGLYRNLELHAYAKKLREKYGFDIINIADMLDIYKNEKNLFFMNPFKLVGLIQNAEHVVTDSFHGCALSINLHRQLHIFMPATSKKRIDNLVSLFRLEKRIVNKGSAIIENKLNYDDVDVILEKERCKATKYLIKIKERLVEQ